MVLDLALAVDGDDIAVGIEIGDLRRAEIKHRPARGIVDRPSQAPSTGSAMTGRSSRTAFWKCSAVSREIYATESSASDHQASAR